MLESRLSRLIGVGMLLVILAGLCVGSGMATGVQSEARLPGGD